MGNIFGTTEYVEKEVIKELPYEDGKDGDVCYDLNASIDKRCQKGLICAPKDDGTACAGSCPLYCQDPGQTKDENDDIISLPVISEAEYECREWIRNPNERFTNTKKVARRTYFDNVTKSIINLN